MKKALKAELTSLAHQILQLKSTEELLKLKQMAGRLHEKLSILEFTERHFDGPQPTIGRQEVLKALESTEDDNKNSTQKETVRKESQPDLDIIKANENIVKPKSLSDEEQQYQQRQQKLEALEGNTKSFMKNDMAHIGGVSYDDLPEFEPVATPEQPKKEKREPKIETSGKTEKTPKPDKKRTSLNDRLNTGISIGLNDRLAFIKHLFDGSASDYNRVLSQLNTAQGNDEAQKLLQEVVKPDYNNWQGKELYEQRFTEIIEKRFN